MPDTEKLPPCLLEDLVDLLLSFLRLGEPLFVVGQGVLVLYALESLLHV